MPQMQSWSPTQNERKKALRGWHRKPMNSPDQHDLKMEYRRLLDKRAGQQVLVNKELARWQGRGPRPAELVLAEAARDEVYFELVR